jgi:hypothetical protein
MLAGALVELSLTEGKLAVIFATAVNVPRGIGNVTPHPPPPPQFSKHKKVVRALIDRKVDICNRNYTL